MEWLNYVWSRLLLALIRQTVEESSAIGTSTRSASNSAASFLSSSTPDRRDRGNAEAGELRARLVDREPRAFVSVFPDDRPQRRVEHGAGVVAEHPLSDRDVAHEVRDAVVVVARKLHHAMYVVAPVDEKAVRGQVGVKIDDLIPTRPALHERVDLLDGIGGHRLLVELLELADA